MNHYLVLDGPMNGQYASLAEIADGYVLDRWSTGELVWVLGNSLDEINNEIEAAL